MRLGSFFSSFCPRVRCEFKICSWLFELSTMMLMHARDVQRQIAQNKYIPESERFIRNRLW